MTHDREAQAAQDQAPGDGQQERTDRRVDHSEQDPDLQHIVGDDQQRDARRFAIRSHGWESDQAEQGEGRHHRDGVDEDVDEEAARGAAWARREQDERADQPRDREHDGDRDEYQVADRPAFGQILGREASAAALHDSRQGEDQNDDGPQ